MNSFELTADVQLATGHIQKMQIAKTVPELKEEYKKATQKLKEVYNDKKTLIKRGE